MKKFLLSAGMLLLCLQLSAQSGNIDYAAQYGYARNARPEGSAGPWSPRRINMPDIYGYRTLKTDLHSHTALSDGYVNSEYRVYEAWLDGLDVLCISDHMPQLKVEDANQPYKDGERAAKERGITLIRGLELSAMDPIGHINILFVEDCNRYWCSKPGNVYFSDQKFTDSLLCMAKQEGAYVQLNHPGWPDMDSRFTDFQLECIRKGLVDGVEIFNGYEFYPRAIDEALQYGLTMTSNSDIHFSTAVIYGEKHRNMTLVFAKENTVEAVHEALNEGRTVAWANDKLAGKEQWLRALLHASIECVSARKEDNAVFYRFYNHSDVDYLLTTKNEQEFILMEAHKYCDVTRNASDTTKFFKVQNMYTSSGSRLEIPLAFLLQPKDRPSSASLCERSLCMKEDGVYFTLSGENGETRYTLDGSKPTQASPLYRGDTLCVKQPCDLRVVTFNGGQPGTEYRQRIGFSYAVKAKAKRNGVNFKYYEGEEILSVNDLLTKGTEKMSGRYDDLLITDGIGKDHFGYIFEGYIRVPETGYYEFNLRSNDGSDLYINGEVAVDNDQHRGYCQASGGIFLQKGLHPYRIRYFEGYGGESFELVWKKPGETVFSRVPKEVLFTE